MLDREYRWKDDGVVDCTRDEWIHTWTIDSYLMHLGVARTLSKDSKYEAIHKDAQRIYPQIAAARVYEFDPDVVSDIFCSIVDTDWPTHDWSELPFEAMYIGLGPGIYVNDETLQTMIDMVENWDNDLVSNRGLEIAQIAKKIADEGHRIVTSGYLVTSSDILRLMVVVDESTEGMWSLVSSFWLPVRLRGQWVTGQTDDMHSEAHVIAYLVRMLEDVRSVVTRRNGLAHKHDWAKRVKAVNGSPQLRKRPPQYYQVRLQPQTVPDVDDEERCGVRQRAEYSHRFDRESHYRHKIRRGKLPLDEKTTRELQRVTKRGNQYQIWTTTAPPAWVEDLLHQRRMSRKEPDEWIAVMRWRVPHTIIGPEDKPYVPASRKLELHGKRQEMSLFDEKLTA